MIEIKAWLTRIETGAGDLVDPPASGVICVVGSNNVGKSLLLREIAARLSNPNARALSLQQIGVEVQPQGLRIEDIESWLDRIAFKERQPSGSDAFQPMYGSGPIRPEIVSEGLNRAPETGSLQNAAHFLIWYSTAGSLVGMATGGIGHPGMGAQTSPIGRMFRDGSIEAKISQLARETFGIDLTLDRINADVRLRVGSVAVDVPRFDNPTVEYADAVTRLPLLDEQGDGVKSFLGLAVVMLTSAASIILVDEPEAFLHPAQARALGRWLARQALERELQVIVATHDRDLLLGFMDAAAPLSVVRVTRDGSSTTLRQLSAADLTTVWADPVLKYSNLLQGLFHNRVCICEADADCRWYGAVLDELANQKGRRGEADDTLFVPSGGKARIPTLAAALSRLGVEAWAVADFDVLDQRSLVISIVEGLGATWSREMDGDYVTMSRAINDADLWPSVKSQGLAAVPQGLPHQAAESLIGELRMRRLLLVPLGEMEGFNRNVSLQGASWVSAMLETDGHKTSEAARQLVEPLIGLP